MKEKLLKVLNKNCEIRSTFVYHHYVYITNTGELLDFIIYNIDPNIVCLMHESILIQKFDSDFKLKQFFKSLKPKKNLLSIFLTSNYF